MMRTLVLSLVLALAVETVQQEGPAAAAKVQGRITERETGKPVRNLRVGLVRKSFTLDGIVKTDVSTSTETDENGAYTILTKPGAYYVATAAQAADGAVFVPQYFPASSDISSAIIYNVSGGSELRDINIAVPPGNRVRVGGRLLDGLGRNLPHNDWVWLVPRHAMAEGVGQERRRDWGGWGAGYRNASRYEISGVAPGSYYLMSWRFDDIADRAETVIPIEVGASDVEVDVISYKGYKTSGRLRFPGASSFSSLQLNSLGLKVQIFARPLDGSPVSDPGAILDRFGLFSFLPMPAGTCRLSIQGIPAPFYVKAVRIGSGPDVLDVGFTVPSVESMEVVIGDDGAEVRGTVRGGGGSTVVLIPEGRPMLRADLYKTVKADKNGAFLIGGIAPGGYRLFAWRDVSGNLFFDPDYLKRFIELGTSLNIAAGSTIAVDLVVIEQ